MVRICVRCNTVSSEHGMSGATTYSFASTSGGAHGRSDMGGAGAGTAFIFALEEVSADALAEILGEGFGKPGEPLAAEADAATTLADGDVAALSTATSPSLASFASGAVGKSRITALNALRASANFRSEVRMRASKTRACGL